MGVLAGGVMVRINMPVVGEELLWSSIFHTAFADDERVTLSGMPKHDFVPRSSDGYSPVQKSSRVSEMLIYCWTHVYPTHTQQILHVFITGLSVFIGIRYIYSLHY